MVFLRNTRGLVYMFSVSLNYLALPPQVAVKTTRAAGQCPSPMLLGSIKAIFLVYVVVANQIHSSPRSHHHAHTASHAMAKNIFRALLVRYIPSLSYIQTEI